jgi:hypothetical protein
MNANQKPGAEENQISHELTRMHTNQDQEQKPESEATFGKRTVSPCFRF